MFPVFTTLKIKFSLFIKKYENFHDEFIAMLKPVLNKCSSCIIFLSIIFSSCEKVIDIDLKKTEPKYIIEAYISNEPGDCKVHITQTVNFSDPAEFPGVAGASVTMQDDSNAPVELTDAGSGMYETYDLNGTEDHTYSLLVKINNQVFTSVCRMPVQVNFDSLSVVDFKSFDGNRKFSNVNFFDPPGKGNAYRFLQYKNEILNKNIFVLNDDFTDGRVNNSLLTFFDRTNDQRIETGDTIKVEMQCVAISVYKFFSSLSQSSTGGADNVSPGNPVSNIRGDVLGYFSAYTKQTKAVVAK